MRNMLLLFSHQLTEIQKDDARDVWEVDRFIYLPESLQSIWSNVSPDLESLEKVLVPIERFLIETLNEEDLVLIQGDFGATYLMVNYTKKIGLLPIYATTNRMVNEYIEAGKEVKKSIFEHRRFRRYE